MRYICNRPIAKTPVRRFKVPTLNSNATYYIDLLNWKDCKVTVPPILLDMSEEQLQGLVTYRSLTPDRELWRFPCHTQGVERCVKLVTEATAAVCGTKNRDGFIGARLRSRELLPTFESKKDYGEK